MLLAYVDRRNYKNEYHMRLFISSSYGPHPRLDLYALYACESPVRELALDDFALARARRVRVC